MINKANSGHPGIVLDFAPALFILFSEFINANPNKANWINKDRFILSAGHGSALLYAILYLCGYQYSIEDLKQFRQFNSKTPGHPEINSNLGVEVSTGPLGQGIGNGVGMALAESILGAQYNQKDFNIFNHYTYVATSDGDLEEGASYEAISLAGHLKLNKLILLYDSNDIQLDGKVNKCFSENIKLRFLSANWNYLLVKDGNNLRELQNAISQAQKSTKPTLIEIKTIIGYGTTFQNTNKVHGAPLNKDIETLKKNLNWNKEPFYVLKEVKQYFKDTFIKRGQQKYQAWKQKFALYQKTFPLLAKKLANVLNSKNIKLDLAKINALNKLQSQATRVSNGNIFSQILKSVDFIIGGSADLKSSTKVIGKNNLYQSDNLIGQDIAFGVREFAMGTITNGLAAYNCNNIIAFASTFFNFVDYLKPALRLAALMKLKIFYFLTHDSILLGEDGPTHQPIEQLASLRATPNVIVIRPADFKECLGAYLLAFKKEINGPVVFVLSRQDVNQLKNSNSLKVTKGGYLIKEVENNLINIIASGSEVEVALKVAQNLFENNIKANVISMPCLDVFLKQDQNYQNKVIKLNKINVAIELGSKQSWYYFVKNKDLIFGLDEFGYSGKIKDIIENLGLDSNSISKKIINYLKNNKKIK